MQKVTAWKLNSVPLNNLSCWAYRISPLWRRRNSSASQLKLNNLLVVRKWSDVRSWQIVLQKSFSTRDQKFSGL
jgi:hypothetical protein